MDFSIDESIEELIAQVDKFSSKTLRHKARLFESNRSWDQNTLNTFTSLGISELNLPFHENGPSELLAYFIALEHLAKGDAGGLLYADTPGPYSWAISALLEHLPKNFFGDLSKSRFAAIYIKDIKDSSNKVLAWAPGSVDEWNGSLGSASTLIVFGNEYISYLNSHHLKFQQSALDALDASNGVEISWNSLLDSQTFKIDAISSYFIRTMMRQWVTAVMLGISQASIDYAIDYGNERVVFNNTVTGHQANAFEIAKVYTEIEASRLAYRAAVSMIKNHSKSLDNYDLSQMINQNYIVAGEVSLSATDLSLQLLGGHGYLKDHFVEKWWREVRTLSILFGGLEQAHEDAGNEALNYHDFLVF